jgi:hypothetical protein
MTYEWHLNRYRLGALPLDLACAQVLDSGTGMHGFVWSGPRHWCKDHLYFFSLFFCLKFVCPSIPAHLGAKAISLVHNSHSTIAYTATRVCLLDTDDGRDVRSSVQDHVGCFAPRPSPQPYTNYRDNHQPPRRPLVVCASQRRAS